MKREVRVLNRNMVGFTGRFLIGFLLSALLPALLLAQQSPPLIVMNEDAQAIKHALRQNYAIQRFDSELRNPAAPLYDVIAVRVSFLPDTSRFTTGDGTFSGPLFDSLQARVDPLPHDAAYFEAHLQFLANYIDQVSDGRTNVNTHLIPEVIQLSREMSAYSPIGLESDSEQELGKLAEMVRETWRKADIQATLDVSGFDPATTAFIIFHAGVGRDIELVGTTLDKTPQDIPTIFFNQGALDELIAQPLSFKGLPVSHSIVLPRTETRQGFDFIQDEPFLVEFSINGLMAASFFNYLGVPDLFNTESGESAIGPFGLMDPLGLFAFNGLFPPEPSAWTKHFLGWADPFLVEGNESAQVELRAASDRVGGKMARVPISSSEYFLVENRNRDLEGDGLVLTVYRDGRIIEQRFENGQEDFNSINIDAFEGGVVIDVDDYDWALPGGVDENENDLLGGILIWHIDERIISEGLASNRVNVDPERRGIDLEEADSAQDLGFPSGNVFGPQAHLGTPFDFFFENNPVLVVTSTGQEISLYQNRFGPDTYPNSNSNAGGASFIILEDFTPAGPLMSFSYRRSAASGIAPVDEFPSLSDEQVPVGSYVSAALNPENGVFYRGDTGQFSVSRSVDDQILRFSSLFFSSPITLPDDRTVVFEINNDGEAYLLVIKDTQSTRLSLGISVGTDPVQENTSLLFDPVSNRVYALCSTSSFNGVLEIEIAEDAAIVTDVVVQGGRIFSIAATDQGEIGAVIENGVSWIEGGIAWELDVDASEDVGQLVLGKDASGTVGVLPLLTSQKLVFLRGDGSVQAIDLERFVAEMNASPVSRYPLLADFNGDGLLEALIVVGNSLLALTSEGGLAEDFPIEMPTGSLTQPLVYSSSEAPGNIILVGTTDGNMHAYDMGNRGKSVPGFPLSVGFSLTATPFMEEDRLYSVASSGELRVWEFDQPLAILWGQRGGNRHNASYIDLRVSVPEFESDGLFVQGKVYNWPNPIRDGRTFFRLTPSADVDITITIIDAAGALIDTLDPGRLRAATATDVEWSTNASSGLYYARVKATDLNGNSETRLIKMAIIR